MVRIAISVEAFEAIASVAVEPYYNERGERLIWLDEVWVDRLSAMRGPAESYSDAILRLVGRRRMRSPMRAAVAAPGSVLVVALADPVTCSRWLDITTCERPVIAVWSAYVCGEGSANVVPLRRA